MLTLASLLAACEALPAESLLDGGTDDGDPLHVADAGGKDARPARFEPEDDPARLAAVECAWMARCAPTLYSRHGWGDREACLIAQRSRLFDKEQALVREGRVRFDRDGFEACIDAHLAEGCSAPECGPFFAGVVTRGGACGDGLECLDEGDFCTGEGVAQCGACAPKLGLFAVCALDDECKSGRCHQRCLPEVSFGSACDKTCVPGGACCDGSCVGQGMGRGICEKAAGRDERCDPTASEAPDCDHALGLTCGDGRCFAIPTGHIGEACDASHWCAGETSCIDGVCSDYPGPGGACDGRCRQETICRNGLCELPPAEGEPCILANDCAPSLICAGPHGEKTCRAWQLSECR